MNFPQYDHHICLVSEQTIPNYLGTIVPGAAPKNVHLVVTAPMKDRADILETALRSKGYAVTQYALASQEANDMMDVLDNIHEKTGDNVAVNVTGGTKIMALNTVGWADLHDRDKRPFLFYVDTDNRKILQIGGHSDQYELTTKLKLKELLKAGAGVDIGNWKFNALGDKSRECLDELMKIFLNDSKLLGLFNKCAKDAENSNEHFANLPCTEAKFQRVLDIASKAEKLCVIHDKIKYKDEETRAWCNGGWLEEFVQVRLVKLRHEGILDDWASNIKIVKKQKKKNQGEQITDSQNELNELDAAFTVANRFFVIECKTSNLAKPKDFQNIIYKLDSLRQRYGGVFSHGMIVSVRKPRAVDIQRCKELRIELLYGKDVLRLEEKLKYWIQNAHR